MIDLFLQQYIHVLLKEDIHFYDSNPDPNIFINWIVEMKQILKLLKFSDYECVKLGAFKLKGYTYFWWQKERKMGEH